jgi:excisionase family DNA binding protein
MMETRIKTKKIYTVIEFSEELGIPQSSVRRWLKNGELRGTKMGKKWLIPASEIERLINPPPRTRARDKR